MKLTVGKLDEPKSCVIVIYEGKVKLRDHPPYGECKIVTHKGKVKRMQREKGEEF